MALTDSLAMTWVKSLSLSPASEKWANNNNLAELLWDIFV